MTKNQEILITEIHPNPKGKDQGKEWIELKNISSRDINLQNYKIEADNFEKTLSNEIITAKDHKIIPFQLKNSSNKIKLLNGDQKLIEEVSYPKSKQGLSWTREGSDFSWKSPSKGLANPESRIIKGELKEKYSDYFIFQTDTKDEKIYYNQHLNKELTKIILHPNQELQIKVEKTQKRESKDHIEEFNILSSSSIPQTEIPQQKEKASTSWLPQIILLTIVLTLFLIKLSHHKSTAQFHHE